MRYIAARVHVSMDDSTLSEPGASGPVQAVPQPVSLTQMGLCENDGAPARTKQLLRFFESH